MDETDVLIVGAGPTGLATANLLGVLGVRTTVVDRTHGPVPEPRAVSVDDEGMRLLQAIDLLAAARDVVVPGPGTRYHGADGARLAYTRGPDQPRNGHTVKNPIDQPEFESLLRRGLDRFEHVRLRSGVELVGLTQREGAVEAQLAGADGAGQLQARYLLGCDGGRSSVRRLTGVKMVGSTFEEPWIVIDTIRDPHDQRFAMHHGDPRRPFVIVPGRDGRCRYEFMLLPGEDAGRATELSFVRELLAGHRAAIEASDIRRCSVYVFHALVAERWRVGRAFLLGDAAHMMPPFAGQGLNSGLRDAANLAWKLAAVVRGQAGEGLLDTYEAERRPHADATVRLSVRMGGIMMTRSRSRARLRDAVLRSSRWVGPLRRYVEQGRFRPSWELAGGLLRSRPGDPPQVGRLLAQPSVLRPDGTVALLDEVLGPWFALVEVEPDGGLARPLVDDLWAQLGARHVALRLGDRMAAAGLVEHVATLHRAADEWFAACAGTVLVVRPDRLVAAAFRREHERAAAVDLRRLIGVGAHADPSSSDMTQISRMV